MPFMKVFFLFDRFRKSLAWHAVFSGTRIGKSNPSFSFVTLLLSPPYRSFSLDTAPCLSSSCVRLGLLAGCGASYPAPFVLGKRLHFPRALFLRGNIICMDQEPMDFHASRHTIGCPQYGNSLAKQHPPIHIRITLKCSHHATKQPLELSGAISHDPSPGKCRTVW